MIYFNKKIDFIIANSIDYYEVILFTIFLVPALIFFFNKICFKFNIVDIPNERKDHSSHMPISGGHNLSSAACQIQMLSFFMSRGSKPQSKQTSCADS